MITSERMDSTEKFDSRWDQVAARVLGRPLTVMVAALCLLQLATWVPHYLTWPWYSDHDVFANAARQWDRGRLPYRDTLGNNFPGEIYLFFGLGKVFGWGKTWPLFAVDAALVGALGLMLILWSRRRFGKGLPGLAGLVTFLGYYLALDSSQVAQRDWHAPAFMVLGLLAAQTWPNRAGRTLAAIGAALALSIRPQSVLLLPAMLMVVAEPGGRPVDRVRRVLEWGLLVAALVGLTMLPLVFAGVWADFVKSVRQAAPGGSYSRWALSSFRAEMQRQLLMAKLWAVVVPVVLLSSRAEPNVRFTVRIWLVALVGVLLYKPISPRPHAYLDHPLALVWSVNLGVLVGLLGDVRLGSSTMRLTAIVLALGLQATGRPRFCNMNRSLTAPAVFIQGLEPEAAPLGYVRNLDVSNSKPYPWKDYRSMLEAIRGTPPGTRVANALSAYPALNGLTDPLPAFPAESVAWLRLVRPEDEAQFARALETDHDAVVVWDPGSPAIGDEYRYKKIKNVIERDYECASRFGSIEIWKRRRSAKDKHK
ncbi:MAG: hypothetical protein ABI353_15735 [Isosphaeraceae bacterium]